MKQPKNQASVSLFDEDALIDLLLFRISWSGLNELMSIFRCILTSVGLSYRPQNREFHYFGREKPAPMPRMTTRQYFLLIALALGVGISPVSSSDVRREDGTEWKYERSDCQAVIRHHAIEESQETLTGRTEHVRIRAGAGTYCYVARDTEKSHVIDDYDARIRIRSDRTGLTAYARVVFPHVIDDQTQEPVRVFVLCDQYDRPDSWQELRINGLAKRLAEHVRYVRQRYGRTADVSGPYIDGHVINAFGGPGTTELWIGESHVTGNVALDSVRAGPLATADNDVTAPKERPRATIQGGLMRLGENLFVPSVLEYRGEPLELVSKLGFNTIAIGHLPNRQFMEDISRHDLWVLCPPPLQTLMNSTRSLDRVIFWDLGTINGPPRLNYSKAIERLRQDDPRRRLLVCGTTPSDHETPVPLRHVARFADVSLHEFRRVAEDSVVDRFDELYDRVSAVGLHGQLWATIDSSDPLFSEAGVELALAAVAAGANGIWFRSNRPLNESDAATNLRRITIEAANIKLQSIRPWTVGGGQRRVISRTTKPEARVVQIVANEAALVLMIRDDSFDKEPIVITSPATTESSDAFQLLPTGLRPLKTRRVSGGLAVTIEDVDTTLPIIVTDNRIATNQVARFAAATSRRSIAIQESLAEASVQYSERTRGASKVARRTARQLYDRGRQLLKSGDATNAYHAFQNARREVYRR